MIWFFYKKPSFREQPFPANMTFRCYVGAFYAALRSPYCTTFSCVAYTAPRSLKGKPVRLFSASSVCYILFYHAFFCLSMLFLKIFFHFLALTFPVFFGIISVMNKLRFLSGNSIKILAAIAMVVDHVGLLFFPFNPIFRMIGRLAFPLFAYMIAEGCKYTKNKWKYLLLMAGLGA
ncbi:MAG: hypothetical protein J6S22_00120, partial [Clostridia bacterium]|nr:hypothetical protein [Clostridia bacterium]